MNIRLKFLQLFLCGVIIGVLAGCDPPTSKTHTYETLVFNVDRTLLEPAITDAALKIEMSAPKGWKSVGDSMLAQVIDGLGDKFTGALQMEPRWIFANEGSRAVCVVSRLEDVQGSLDETVLKSMETTYRARFPEATIQRTIFMKDTFLVHQLMVATSNFVLIRFVCADPESPVFEINYFVPKNVYESELRSIESSIGSIKSLTN